MICKIEICINENMPMICKIEICNLRNENPCGKLPEARRLNQSVHHLPKCSRTLPCKVKLKQGNGLGEGTATRRLVQHNCGLRPAK